MKLLIVLSVIACGYADKLDRTYLPPANAATSGGSPGSLNTPLAASAFGQPAGFGQGRSLGAPGKAAPFGASGNSGFGAPSNQFNQPGSAQSGFPGQAVGPNFDAGFAAPAQNFGNQAQDYQRSQPARAQASAEKNAEILRYDSQNDGETFNYSFETSNGISAEESGVATNGVQAQGAFAYTDDDGQMFRVAYTADENGYQPQGDHLPTPPPIPEEILKSIEENARAAAAGTQEGAYNPNEDNDVTPNQQYNANAPGSYNYGTSNAAPRPQIGAQGFQAGPSQQYGAPNAGSARSLNGFGQIQAKPSQVYGSPSSGGLPGSNAAARPNNFGQPQGPQQFTPSGPTSSASSFGSSGPASQASPNQYQASPSGQLPSARGLQGSGSAQAQYASGYQYNQPQAGFAGNAKNGPSNQQFQPQGGAPTAPQGYSRPSGNNGFPVASGASGQGSFGSAAQPKSQGSFGSAPRPKSQGGFGSAPRPKSQGGFESAPSSGSYGSAPVSQGSFAPASQGSFAPAGPSGFSGPNGPSGPKGPSSFGANSQGSSGPSGPSGPKGPSSFGANSQGSFGSPARPTSTYGTPSGSQPSFGGSSTGFSKPGARNLMPESGYEYNRPSSQFGGSQQPQGGNQFGGPQNGNAFGGASQKGFQSANQGRPGQSFGGPRAPPSFTEEEGYKY